MPPARAAIQSPRGSSERTTTSCCATSVPVGRRENSRLESLRSKKQKLLPADVEDSDTPPSHSPTLVIVRGRKRASSSCATPQVDRAADTSVSVVELLPDASIQRPRKRHKRSSSTPAAPRSSQLSTRLHPHRRPRSRADSPATDLEYVPPTRTSARLSRKIHSFIDVSSPDIYTHLADPDGAGDFLREPSVTSVALSTANEMATPLSVTRSSLRGRRRKIDLTDENAKKDLMEEWARMRQSQGAPLSGIDGNACFSQTRSDDNAKSTGSISSMQLESVSQPGSSLLDTETVTCQSTATIGVSHSRETIPDVSVLSSTQIDIEDARAKKTDHKDLVMPCDGATEQPAFPTVDMETPSASMLVSRLGDETPTDRRSGGSETAPHPESSPRLSSPFSASPSRENSVHVNRTEATGLPANEQEEAMNPNRPPKDSYPPTLLQTYSIDDNSTDLGLDGEFYMLDVPEIFTLPWVPVSSHLYVPPGLGKLISGMREQLTMEVRARQRAEGLYQTELSRRISAEKIIEDLRMELEGKRKDSCS